MRSKEDLITDIMKCCREAINITAISNKKNNFKFSEAYECLINYPNILNEEYLNVIPNKIKKDYMFLIQLSKEQIKDREEQDKLNPHVSNLNCNYIHFFLKLKKRATKALIAIYNIYFCLLDEYYAIQLCKK